MTAAQLRELAANVDAAQALIRERLGEGATVATIARELGWYPARVLWHMKALGLPVGQPGRQKGVASTRVEEMLEALAEGERQVSVARRFGVSQQAISNAVKRHGRRVRQGASV